MWKKKKKKSYNRDIVTSIPRFTDCLGQNLEPEEGQIKTNKQTTTTNWKCNLV